MADTLQNIKLVANTWTDLYAASGITIGVQIAISNLTNIPIKFHASAAVPANAEKDDDTGSFDRILSYQQKVNDSGDLGAWAYSHTDSIINVKVF